MSGLGIGCGIENTFRKRPGSVAVEHVGPCVAGNDPQLSRSKIFRYKIVEAEDCVCVLLRCVGIGVTVVTLILRTDFSKRHVQD